MPLRPIPRPKAPRVGRPTGKFTQHRRLDFLREKLASHAAGLTLDELAALLRVTTRSIRRYLRELALVTELESVEVRPGGAHVWRIKPSERGRAVTLRRTQAYAVLAGRRVFDVLKGSALFDEIDVALREIEQVAHRPFVRAAVRGDVSSDARLDDRFVYVPPQARSYANRSEDVDAAFQAMAELRPLRFRYPDGSARDARVHAHPYALVIHRGAITCVARDVDRATTRAFAFDRMSELQASADDRFELPLDFRVDDWLQGDFGVARAARVVRVLVEFEARAGEVVRARRVHPSQKLAVAADGRVRASLSVPETPEVLAEVRAWILAFGAAAHVLEPRELADDVAAELRRAADRYAERTDRSSAR
ncbi:MAG: WYL domain-containing protein [Myxococcales bacterium]|nr:WYL domain-containing protein [Myxococcales bacterium]